MIRRGESQKARGDTQLNLGLGHINKLRRRKRAKKNAEQVTEVAEIRTEMIERPFSTPTIECPRCEEKMEITAQAYCVRWCGCGAIIAYDPAAQHERTRIRAVGKWQKDKPKQNKEEGQEE